MKKIILMSVLALLGTSAFAKDIKTVVVTTTPQMHCENCEKKIKSNIRFERGVKAIETSIPNQTVTIKYDADKITVEKLLKGFTKFGYKARVVKPGEKVKINEGEECQNM